MRYPIGSKFMRHVDEDVALFEPIRNSVSFLVYLTPDDWTADDGGALLIHENGQGGEPREVLPVGGTLVVYDSTTEARGAAHAKGTPLALWSIQRAK